MSTKRPTPRITVLLSFRFLGTAMLGGLTMGAASAFGSEVALLAMLGTWMSVLAGLLLAHIAEVEAQANLQARLLTAAGVPLKLARRPQLLDAFCDISQSLGSLARYSNPVLWDVAGGS